MLPIEGSTGLILPEFTIGGVAGNWYAWYLSVVYGFNVVADYRACDVVVLRCSKPAGCADEAKFHRCKAKWPTATN